MIYKRMVREWVVFIDYTALCLIKGFVEVFLIYLGLVSIVPSMAKEKAGMCLLLERKGIKV